MSFLSEFKLHIAIILAVLGALAGGIVYAQLEGADRGIAPLASTGDFEVTGVKVNVEGDDAFDARKKGWQEAQRKAWQMLYARTQGGKTAGLSDGTLNTIVSAIIVEEEQIGPKRYVATLGVMFDRARAGSILGVGGRQLRSPPLLVLPIMWSGGSPQVFENRTEWQKAWARYKAGDSAIDYVRPHGSDSESLLLTAGQADRRNRRWWRMILDQFGAADVIIPIVRLQREYPGGPVLGRFSARYGPDSKFINSFTLKVDNSDDIPKMMDQAIMRLDNIFTSALSRGILKTDRSLILEDPFDLSQFDLALDEEFADDLGLDLPSDGGGSTATTSGSSNSDAGAETTAPTGVASTITVQFNTPDVGAVGRGESSVRSVPGVSSASTSSLALGGISVMRVTYSGDLSTLASALRARGWSVQQGVGALRINKGGGGSTQRPPGPAPAPPPEANENNGTEEEEPEQ